MVQVILSSEFKFNSICSRRVFTETAMVHSSRSGQGHTLQPYGLTSL